MVSRAPKKQVQVAARRATPRGSSTREVRERFDRSGVRFEGDGVANVEAAVHTFASIETPRILESKPVSDTEHPLARSGFEVRDAAFSRANRKVENQSIVIQAGAGRACRAHPSTPEERSGIEVASVREVHQLRQTSACAPRWRRSCASLCLHRSRGGTSRRDRSLDLDTARTYRRSALRGASP